jgi:hypothetical protein
MKEKKKTPSPPCSSPRRTLALSFFDAFRKKDNGKSNNNNKGKKRLCTLLSLFSF